MSVSAIDSSRQINQSKVVSISPPQKIGEWSFAQTVSALSRKLPQSMLKSKSIQGQSLPYLPWYRACSVLDKYAPGWSYKVSQPVIAGAGLFKPDRDNNPVPLDRLVITVSLTLVFSDGTVTRDATGTELLSLSGYGDPSSNAESMALRRAAAKFGLAAYLYEK